MNDSDVERIISELRHANNINVSKQKEINDLRELLQVADDAYFQLEEVYIEMIESKKRHIQRIKTKARSNPWPWTLPALTLIIGIIVGKLS